MSERSRKEHRRLGALIDDPESLPKLRAFVAEHLPNLDGTSEWTQQQLRAVGRVYLECQDRSAWSCVHGCGSAVQGFGQQCADCREFHGEMGPIDWECIGGH